VFVFITSSSVYQKIEIILLCCFLNEDRKKQALAIIIPRVCVLVLAPASTCMCPWLPQLQLWANSLNACVLCLWSTP